MCADGKYGTKEKLDELFLSFSCRFGKVRESEHEGTHKYLPNSISLSPQNRRSRGRITSRMRMRMGTGEEGRERQKEKLDPEKGKRKFPAFMC